MFINIVEYPPIRMGKDEEFRKWFEWSNTLYEGFDGFISRRLLKPVKGREHYVEVIEHENEITFMAMHLSDERRRAWAKVNILLEGSPTLGFYEVIIASEEKYRHEHP
ncbi:putative extracellular polysaccharide biosynthesis enzyme [Candidatus Methanoperedens nitroreducens]|uniref:Putative extracellular polysaccharide biosynthesis enzyme n=1 Tax=Candidatus Methanoperedens nitratireducens TaxID=1392998 RepID=A0A062V845_9EURY|nr:hypothetical protein [Candidatus Methanoperedens nitroreducens]KCZ73442.1 putative extracellular polysaccharide biosynthesis enzyme [Candidatus Methanoperedens nitroreducens]MDJ1422602.1 hypothetical protein [Candidatus Methanoperedens sp.]